MGSQRVADEVEVEDNGSGKRQSAGLRFIAQFLSQGYQGRLAGLLLGMNAPGAQMIASVTFIAILMTILIQAPTTKWLGRRLGLLEGKGQLN